MINNPTFRKILKLMYHYMIFFVLIAFLVTCTTTLFITQLSKELSVELTSDNLNMSAKLTFLNVIFLCAIFTLIDAIRRRRFTKKILEHIGDGVKRVVKGDFNVRIEPVSYLGMGEEFNEIIECFNTMTKELAGVETLRTDFVANVSHEMKTPLSVMQNYGVLLQLPNLTDDKRIEYAKGVTDGAKRLADMMSNILKLNRLENQQIYPQTKEFDLGEQLCECLLQYENVWTKKDIELDINIEENVKVTADDELLSHVWNNLFSNAFKFTNEQGKVTVSLTTDEDHAIVKVKDSGCGMTKEVGEHIFEKFYQGDTSHATKGNGLGLALVKRVIDIMQAEISVESELNKGTTFTVRILKSKEK